MEDNLGNAAKAWNEVAVVVLAWNGCDVPAELEVGRHDA
jgi:hypothetical protein